MLSGTQGKLIAGLIAVVAVLLVAVAYLAGRSATPRPTAGSNSSGSATVTVSPPPSPTPSPSPSPTPSPAAAVLGPSGTLLQANKGSDAGPGRGNGPGCQIWVDSGWTLGDCGITPVNGNSPEASIAWVTEHKQGASGTQWRVFFMTTSANDAYWHTKLYYGDDMGGGFTNITVKGVDVSGGGVPWLVVGFRHNRTSGGGTILDYDVIDRGAPGTDPAVLIHRQLGDGVAVLGGQHIEDYDDGAGGSTYTKSVINFVEGSFKITATSQIAAAQAPKSDLP